MLPRPHTPYFLVKIKREEETHNKSKLGSIIIPDTLRFMAYNTQCGEIVSIGKGAAKHFPEAKVGHILLMHHFVQGESEQDAREDHLIHQDEVYNYYIVTAYEHYGKNVESYGVWDGEKIIPNKDYIFLEVKRPTMESDIDLEELGKQIGFVPNVAMSESEGGLIIFKEWEQSRESMEERQAYLKEHNEYLTRSNPEKEHISKALIENEKEMGSIAVRLNKKEYIPFKIAYRNKELCNANVTIAYMYNTAATTEIKFMDKTYIVAKSKYVGALS